MAVSIDKGTAPPAVAQQCAALADELGDVALEHKIKQAAQSNPAATHLITPLRPTEPVTLDFLDNDKKKLLSIKFKVYEVDVSDHHISMAMPPDLTISPSTITNVLVGYRNQCYAAAWVGGNFKFTGMKISGMSFLRHDQNRQSGSGQDSEHGERSAE